VLLVNANPDYLPPLQNSSELEKIERDYQALSQEIRSLKPTLRPRIFQAKKLPLIYTEISVNFTHPLDFIVKQVENELMKIIKAAVENKDEAFFSVLDFNITNFALFLEDKLVGNFKALSLKELQLQMQELVLFNLPLLIVLRLC